MNKKPTQKKKLEVLSEYMGVPVTVCIMQEYKTLKIDGKIITQGEREVNKRIDGLIRERGLQYDLNM